jgi:hypothetical protein
MHPDTGKIVNLENGTDLDERIQILEEFHGYPARFTRHFL